MIELNVAKASSIAFLTALDDIVAPPIKVSSALNVSSVAPVNLSRYPSGAPLKLGIYSGSSKSVDISTFKISPFSEMNTLAVITWLL